MDELPPDVNMASGDDPGCYVEHQLMMDQLWQVVSEHLTPTEHGVAFLTWALDKDDAFIANVLGIPTEGTVRTHRSRPSPRSGT